MHAGGRIAAVITDVADRSFVDDVAIPHRLFSDKYPMTHDLRRYIDAVQTLNESGDADLFHFTDGRALQAILRDDALGWSADHTVSLTRDPNHFYTQHGAKQVVLILDGRKLRQRYHLEPRFGDIRARPGQVRHREAEERVRRVHPLSPVLKEIVLDPQLIQDKRDEGVVAAAVEYTRQHHLPISVASTTTGWLRTRKPLEQE